MVVNDENDTSLLVPMLDQVKENLADGGYATGEQLSLPESGITKC